MTGMKSLVWLAVVLLALQLDAQAKPDFSGHWVPMSPAGAQLGPDQVVKQDATTLTMEHASSGGGHRFVYKLDGSDNHSTLMNVQSVARASWNGDKLGISRRDNYPDGRQRENRQVWSLDPSGNLIIESTDGLVGETPTTLRRVYKKRQ